MPSFITMETRHRKSTIPEDIIEILSEFDLFLDNVFESPLSSPNSDTSEKGFDPRPSVDPVPSGRDRLTDDDDETERLKNFENAHKFFCSISNVRDRCDSVRPISSPTPYKYFQNVHKDFKEHKQISEEKISEISTTTVGIPQRPKQNLQEDISENQKNLPCKKFLREKFSEERNICSSKNIVTEDKLSPSAQKNNFVKFSECLKFPSKTPKKRLPEPDIRTGLPINLDNRARLPIKLDKRDKSSPVLNSQITKFDKVIGEFHQSRSSSIDRHTSLPRDAKIYISEPILTKSTYFGPEGPINIDKTKELTILHNDKTAETKTFHVEKAAGMQHFVITEPEYATKNIVKRQKGITNDNLSGSQYITKENVAGPLHIAKNNLAGSQFIAKEKVDLSGPDHFAKENFAVLGAQSNAKDYVARSTSIAKDNLARSQSAIDSVARPSSIAKDIVARPPSITKDIVARPPSIARDIVARPPSIAKQNVAGPQHIAKDSVVGPILIRKDNVARPPSIAKDEVAHPSPIAKDKVVQPPSIVNDKVAQPPSIAKDNLAKPPSIAKDKVAQLPSIAKDEVAHPSPIAKDKVVQPPSIAKDKVTQPPFIAKDNLAKPPSIAKDKVAQLPSIAKDEVAHPSPIAKDKVAQPPSIAKDKVAQLPSIAKDEVAHPSPIAKDKVAQPPSIAKDKVAQLPSIAKDEVAHPSPIAKDKVAQPPSIAKDKVAQPPSIAKDNLAKLPSIAKDKVAQLPSIAKYKVAQPPSIAKDKVEQPPSIAKDEVAHPSPIAKDKVAQPPSIAKDNLAKPPSIAKDKVAQLPSIAKDKVAQPPSIAKDKVAQPPSIAKDKVAQLPSIAMDNVAQPPSIAKDKVAQPPSIAKDKVAQLPSIANYKVAQPPSIAKDKVAQSTPTSKDIVAGFDLKYPIKKTDEPNNSIFNEIMKRPLSNINKVDGKHVSIITEVDKKSENKFESNCTYTEKKIFSNNTESEKEHVSNSSETVLKNASKLCKTEARDASKALESGSRVSKPKENLQRLVSPVIESSSFKSKVSPHTFKNDNDLEKVALALPLQQSVPLPTASSSSSPHSNYSVKGDHIHGRESLRKTDMSYRDEYTVEMDKYIAYIHDLLSSHTAKIAAGIMSVEHRGTKALELWSRRVTQGYEGVNVNNMTTAWRDGLAFCALIHHFRPELIDFKSLKAEKILENNALAFRVAEQHLGIPALLDAEDMVDTSVPDRLSILTYVSQFYQAFNAQGLIGPGGRRSPLASNNTKNVTPTKVPFISKTPTSTPVSTNNTPLKAQPISKPPATLQTKTEKEFKTDKVTAGVRGRREECTACNKTVFLAERIAVGFPGQLRHRTCFRCDRCSAQLTLASYYETEKGQFCCETCPDEERAISSGDEGDGVAEDRGSSSTTRGKADDLSTSDSESDSDDSVGSGEESLSGNPDSMINNVSQSEEPSKAARSLFLQDTLETKIQPRIEEEKATIQSLLPLCPPLPSSPPPPKPARTSLNFSQENINDSVPLPVNAQPPSTIGTDECHSGLSRCDFTKSEETTPPSELLDTGQSNSIKKESNIINRLKLFENSLGKNEGKEVKLKLGSVEHKQQSKSKEINASKLSSDAEVKELKDVPPRASQVSSIKSIFETNQNVKSVNRPSSVLNNEVLKTNTNSQKHLDKNSSESLDKLETTQTSEPSLISKSVLEMSYNNVNKEISEHDSNLTSPATEEAVIKKSIPKEVPSDESFPSKVSLRNELPVSEESNPFEDSPIEDNNAVFNDLKSKIEFENNRETAPEVNLKESTNEYKQIEAIPVPEIKSVNGTHEKNKIENVELQVDQDIKNINAVLDSKSLPLKEPVISEVKPIETPVTTETIEDVDYPDELNPFEDEVEEKTETPEKVDVQTSKSDSVGKKIIKAPQNPFDSEEEDDCAVPEIDISKLKLSSNPFWSDDESDSSASTPSKRKVKPPRPPPPTLRRDILPPTKNKKLILLDTGGFNTPPSPSLSNRSSSSDQSTFRLKKKQRHAPAPPSLYISPFNQGNNSSALNSHHNLAGEACGTDDVLTSKMQKDLQNQANKMMGSSYTRDAHSPSTVRNGIVTPKSERGEWRRKKGPAPLRPVPQKRAIRKLPMRQIQQELYDIEVKQTELERQGVLLETIIREKTEGSTTGSSTAEDSISLSSSSNNPEADKSITSIASNSSNGSQGVEVEDMILQLFELVNEKNDLFRRQTELMYLKREKRLEEEYAELEYQIRCLMLKPQTEKSDIEIAQEEELIARLVKVVEQRDQVVNCLEMERQREALEDESIATHMIKYQEKHIDGIESDEDKQSSKKKKKKKLRLLKKKKKGKNKEKEEKIDADKDVDETELKKEKRKKKTWFRKPL